jgi:CheY-like chemotaxis protein
MPAKILIADDEAHIRLLIEQTLEDLEDAGVELLAAADGTTALNLIQTERPALVFLDIMMPRMNGFDVCQAVKQNPALQDIHIIILTAKGQGFDRQKGLEVGANAYVTKPFDPDALYDMAADVLNLSG